MGFIGGHLLREGARDSAQGARRWTAVDDPVHAQVSRPELGDDKRGRAVSGRGNLMGGAQRQ
jgi:hypothetical protein